MTPTDSSYPIHATYGETHQTHGVLTCSADSNVLPPILLDLTDKPPGYTSSGEAWGPSVGCGPIGQWWALWWTEPDPSASRAGMVTSRVALWPLDAIGNVKELCQELEVLSGGKPIALPSPSVVALTAEALIADAASAPVFGNLQLWPGLLAMLWERLWPEARQAFSARVAISPSQGGESVAPPWLYGVDSGRLLEWANSHVITSVVPETNSPSRAACWLMGQADPILKELLESVTSLGSTLNILRRMARAADYLETLRKAPEAGTAIYLLRALLNVTSDRGELQIFKQEAVSVLAATAPDASPTVIVSLANIPHEQLLDGARLAEIVQSWIANVLPHTSVPDADTLLSRLDAGTAQEWWLTAARSGIAEGLRSSSGRWNEFLFSWLSEKLHARLIASLGIIIEATEQQMLTIALSSELSAAQVLKLRQNANTLGWSAIHAVATLQGATAVEALQGQLAFRPDPLLGLSIMVDRICGDDLIEATVRIANPTLSSLVAIRTSKNPTLLAPLDLGVPAWRALWELHVGLGGNPWPTSVDQYFQAKSYLSVVKAGSYRSGLIAQLAEDFAPVALDLEDRRSLWGRLDPMDARVLAGVVARLILQRAHAADDLVIPEPYLLEQVMLQVHQGHLSAAQVRCLLVWDSLIPEFKAISLVRRIRDWSKGSRSLGEMVQERQWRSIAKEIASEYRYTRTEVLPALHACYELLGFFDRLLIPRPPDAIAIGIDMNEIIAGVAEVGCDVAHDRLEDLWVRAGGRAASLSTSGNSADRWLRASNQAASGSLPEGLKALVRVLLDEFPNNEKLKLLEQVLHGRTRVH
ncbi:effector-associated domain EAD1-containing protein [Pseudomonas sp. FW300-N2A2]|uniref:GAP1-N1 domain-containing protein n=1 Tax=Pseudomonas sp. FW300-N2A2 TaxID=2751316 RepID=UPI001A90E16E|nr:effector-associated domain EAD1-containing protein [Pseudomonas sp. FW300-N2A2]